jgi:hypothetical protein
VNGVVAPSQMAEIYGLFAHLKPCVRCLHDKAKRRRAGISREFCIIQCLECGFNVTANSFEEAVAQWNGFKVWTLFDQFRPY